MPPPGTDHSPTVSPAEPVASSEEGDHSDAPRPVSAAGAIPKAAAPSIFETAKTFYQREKNKASTHAEDNSPMDTGAEPSFKWTSTHLALLTELKSDTKKKPSWQAVAARLGCTVSQAKAKWQELLQQTAIGYCNNSGFFDGSW